MRTQAQSLRAAANRARSRRAQNSEPQRRKLNRASRVRLNAGALVADLAAAISGGARLRLAVRARRNYSDS